MITYKNIGLCLALSFICVWNNAYASDVETMRKSAENNIKSCEQTYLNVKALKSRLDTMKKPGIFASKAQKNAYANKDLYKKVFDSRFEEFTRFTNDKIKIRTQKDFVKLRDEIAAYTSNCARFSAGLVGFIDWATTGKAAPGFERIYNNMVDEVKNESQSAAKASK